MKEISISLAVISTLSLATVGATQAYFTDTVTSNSNTFANGTLDLTLNGNNGTNTVKFTLTNLRPGNQPTGTYKVKNVGTVNGYIDLHNISITSEENGCLDPESEAGDVTCGTPNQGELPDRLGYTLYVDYNCNGSYSTGDRKVFDTMARNVLTDYNFNEPLGAGQERCFMNVFNWWSGATDNLAQGDNMTVDMTFELGQTTGQ